MTALNSRTRPAAIVIALCLACVVHAGQPSESVGYVAMIADGDTLTLLVERQQVRIRLAEIDTPERGQPWGNRAKKALVSKVFNRVVRVVVVDVDRYGRTVSRVWEGDHDICRELVADGHAWVYRRYNTDQSLLDDEADAQNDGLGLWGLAEEPVPPWEWRREAFRRVGRGGRGDLVERRTSRVVARRRDAITSSGGRKASWSGVLHLPRPS